MLATMVVVNIVCPVNRPIKMLCLERRHASVPANMKRLGCIVGDLQLCLVEVLWRVYHKAGILRN